MYKKKNERVLNLDFFLLRIPARKSILEIYIYYNFLEKKGVCVLYIISEKS